MNRQTPPLSPTTKPIWCSLPEVVVRWWCTLDLSLTAHHCKISMEHPRHVSQTLCLSRRAASIIVVLAHMSRCEFPSPVDVGPGEADINHLTDWTPGWGLKQTDEHLVWPSICTTPSSGAIHTHTHLWWHWEQVATGEGVALLHKHPWRSLCLRACGPKGVP